MADLKMFSPSAIKTYSECPIKYELMYLDRWAPKQADRAFWGRVAGHAFAEGTAIIHRKLPVEQAINVALGAITAEIEVFLKAGGLCDRIDLEAVKMDVAHGLRKYSETNPFKTWKEITYVEYSLGPAYGNPRLDVIGRDSHNVLSFADLKFKRYLDTDYVNKTVEEYRYDWQFLHYQWAMQEHFKEPVNAYLCLVRLKSAWQAQLFEFSYPADLLRSVGISVKRWSEHMQLDIDRGAAIGTTHDTKFGPCPYKEACLKMGFNEELMKERYVQVPRIIAQKEQDGKS